MEKNIRKLTIIGSGPAGLTAAIYASRANLAPLLIEGKEPGGQLMSTTYVENWPGEERVLGPELMLNLRKHAKSFGTEFLNQNIVKVDFKNNPFTLYTEKGLEIKSHSVILATGANPKRLNCKGETEYWSRGVSTCAVCDGAIFKNRQVVIVGGGDSAMESASFMTNFTNRITIVHILDQLTASHSMKERVLKNPNINIIYNSTVTEIKGDNDKVTSIIVTNQNTHQETEIKTDAVFIAIGLNPNTKLFKDQLELNSYGYIILKDHTETSVKGIFAAGDVADSRYRQAITSAGTGCAASLDAERYLKTLDL